MTNWYYLDKTQVLYKWKKLSFSIKGNKYLTDRFLLFRSSPSYEVWKTSKQADGGSDLGTIHKCSGKKNRGKRHRSENKGSMGSTPSFDTSCGRAAKLPNLCASYLSLPTAPAPPSTSCLFKLYNSSLLEGNLSTHSNQPNSNKIQSQYNVILVSPKRQQ